MTTETDEAALRIWQEAAYDFSVRCRLPSIGLVKTDCDEFKIEYARRLLSWQRERAEPGRGESNEEALNDHLSKAYRMAKELEQHLQTSPPLFHEPRKPCAPPPAPEPDAQNEQDAKRYRWLWQTNLWQYEELHLSAEELDAKIDAALRGKEEDHG